MPPWTCFWQRTAAVLNVTRSNLSSRTTWWRRDNKFNTCDFRYMRRQSLFYACGEKPRSKSLLAWFSTTPMERRVFFEKGDNGVCYRRGHYDFSTCSGGARNPSRRQAWKRQRSRSMFSQYFIPHLHDIIWVSWDGVSKEGKAWVPLSKMWRRTQKGFFNPPLVEEIGEKVSLPSLFLI